MKKNKRKIFSALGMAFLVASTGALASPIASNSDFIKSSLNLKIIQKNPSKFLRNENLDVSSDFDYIEELQKIYVIKEQDEFAIKLQESSITTAIQNEDYDSYKEAIIELSNFPKDTSPISKEDFEILVQLRKSSKTI